MITTCHPKDNQTLYREVHEAKALSTIPTFLIFALELSELEGDLEDVLLVLDDPSVEKKFRLDISQVEH
ncbi:hypothetical protein RclHR1_25130004 [Rhizophagus clarus]|uniref:Uncharacterized protein n=1 Tax=Rhizophagus clarus TaxID=94130 RepID=A0A2Z6R3G8_9GLOM|nr:hypothetical protein RclHR1_25130004 [Rhizophagus clarus]